MGRDGGRLGALLVAAALVAARGADAADDKTAEKPDAVVFLDALAKPAAPSQAAIGDLVVLTEVPEKDPWFAAVAALGVPVAEVVPFKPASLDDAFARLKARKPGFVLVLIRPSSLDVNFHFEFLERAAALDDDPFVDFAFGYLTGATPEECVASAKAIAAARKTEVPKSILEFGPLADPRGPTDAFPHKWADKFEMREFFHKEDAPDVAKTLKALRGVGVWHAEGHGSPDRVTHGLTGAQIRSSGLDLFPGIYVSGPCWCGTPGRFFEFEKGAFAEKQVAPQESFVLALLKARATAVLAGLDPDRGETASHELERLMLDGGPIGLAAKSTYDDVALASRRPKLDLPRYQDKRGTPHRDIYAEMIAGGACRALFGDPTFAPFPACGATDPFRVTTERTKTGVAVTWRADDALSRFWTPIDVFRAGNGNGNWTHRLRFRFELPRADAAKLSKFEVVSVAKDGKPLAFAWPTAALESWGDRVFVHAMVVFPEDGTHSTLEGGKTFEAKLVFRE